MCPGKENLYIGKKLSEVTAEFYMVRIYVIGNILKEHPISMLADTI